MLVVPLSSRHQGSDWALKVEDDTDATKEGLGNPMCSHALDDA